MNSPIRVNVVVAPEKIKSMVLFNVTGLRRDEGMPKTRSIVACTNEHGNGVSWIVDHPIEELMRALGVVDLVGTATVSAEDFIAEVRAAVARSGITKVSEAVRVPIATSERWLCGQNLPVPEVRTIMMTALSSLAKE
jgi:hypothetical protein